MKCSLAGCVILYNPDEDVCENIASYIDCLEILYVVDNYGGAELIEKLARLYPQKITALRHAENMGIAASLNEALAEARGKYDLLLTMDQDSKFYRGGMKIYAEEAQKFDWDETLGIGPLPVSPDAVNLYCTNVEWGGSERLITSGNIINVANALSIGGFDNDLFIDEVDYDFCYKGIRAGFKLYKNRQGIYLVHHLGNTFSRSFLGHTFVCMNHNKIRKYYIMRNRMEMVHRYHDLFGVKFVLMYLKSNMRLIFDIVFFEEDKAARLRYALLGFCDFMRGQLGKRV